MARTDEGPRWLLVLDVETGALRPGAAPLCEVGAVLASPDLEEVAAWQGLVQYDPAACDHEALRWHRWGPEDPRRRPEAEVLTGLAAWLVLEARRAEISGLAERCCCLAHGAPFDRPWMQQAADRAWAASHAARRFEVLTELDTLVRILDGRWECSQASWRMVCDRVEGGTGASLASLARRAGHWSREQCAARVRHDALEDARACLAGYRWLVRRLRGCWPGARRSP